MSNELLNRICALGYAKQCADDYAEFAANSLEPSWLVALRMLVLA